MRTYDGHSTLSLAAGIATSVGLSLVRAEPMRFASIADARFLIHSQPCHRNRVGHRRMQPTQIYVIESSRLPPSPPVRLLSQGFRALPGSRIRNPAACITLLATDTYQQRDKDHESSRLQRTPRR